MAIDNWNYFIVLLAGVATLAIFSFLIKENPFYRFFEHVFIGISAGFGALFSIKNFLWPKVVVPLLALDIVQYPDGTYSGEYNYLVLLYLLPMAFGLLYYAIYFKKFAWLAKIVIGFSLGAGGALYFRGFFNQIIPSDFKQF
jgi:4-hydroxybenzoate polyprenyltransferase